MSTDEPLIVGAERGLANVMAQVRRASTTDANVLVRGETGTGKELIARALHIASHRRIGPFVVANCAAIPSALMESELFGHVRGAFTSAVADRIGFFESAANGTLLLDEIGDLHIRLQAKILRVVENGTFHRVGSTDVVANRARLIAATNQPLELLMERGRFRGDLFYRLEVVTIEIPPLRQRVADIPALVRHFLARGQQRMGLPASSITPGALDALMSYGWPGNVRELHNVAERLLLLATDTIEREHVERLLRGRSFGAAEDCIRPLREIEREAILRTLEHFAGNRTRASQALEIGRRTLQNKLREYDLADRAKEERG